MLEHIVGVGPGNFGFAQKLHSGFSRSSAGLVVVAGNAGADDVVPGVGAVAPARHDVVERELAGLFAAVLAGKSVAVEYRLS